MKTIWMPPKGDSSSGPFSLKNLSTLAAAKAATIADQVKRAKYELSAEKAMSRVSAEVGPFTEVLTTIQAQRTKVADALKQAEADYQNAQTARTSATDALNGLLTGMFGQPSEIRKTLSGASATVDSIISTYQKLATAVEQRFTGYTGGDKDSMLAFLKRQTQALVDLAKQRSAVATKLADAQKQLDTAVQQRDQFAASITSSMQSYASSLTQFVTNGVAASADTMVATFQDRLSKMRQFAEDVKSLSAQGLDRGVIQQILGMGVDSGGALAASLKQASPDTIKSLNSMFTDMQSTAQQFGTQMGDTFYGQAVTDAQALVRGFQSQQATIDAQMNAITASIEDKMSLLTSGMANLGVDAAKALVDGLKSQEATLLAQAQSIVDKINAILSTASGALGAPVAAPSAPVPAGAPLSALQGAYAGSTPGSAANARLADQLASGGTQVHITAHTNATPEQIAREAVIALTYGQPLTTAQSRALGVG